MKFIFTEFAENLPYYFLFAIVPTTQKVSKGHATEFYFQMQERLQKIIANAGITSRRFAEKLIDSGRVSLNGKVVTTLGVKADPSKDKIRINGKLLSHSEPKLYILLNKPSGYITSLKDPEGRPTVMDLLGNIRQRVYPVGRLDYDTEGLLIITNDGHFANNLMHPRHKVQKTYLVKIQGQISEKSMKNLIKGVYIDGRKATPIAIKKKGLREKNSWIEITLQEGRNRQVKRMLEILGYRVIKLKRTSYGSLSLKGIPLGAYRFLTRFEVAKLKKAREALS